MSLLSIFAAGVLHGLGPDHLAAISGFGAATGAGARRLAVFALRFAAGHAGVILLAGVLTSFGRTLLPVAWERAFELGAAGLLSLTGTGLLVGLLTGRISVHSHPHQHDGASHQHFHLHLRGRERHRHVHGAFAVAMGGLFALGGARTLLAVTSLAMAQSALEWAAGVTLFAAGIVLAMVAYGVGTGRVLRYARSVAAARVAAFAVAAFSLFAGVWALSARFFH
jgi:hypothetical protein